jgi:hypothetical protein
MPIRHLVSALALLSVLSAISGCKRQVNIELSGHLTPIIYVHEGQVINWRPSSGVVTLTFDKGLCKESGPLRGTQDQPAQCSIAKQNFRDKKKPNIYTLTVSSPDGNVDPSATYQVNVKSCGGFCH